MKTDLKTLDFITQYAKSLSDENIVAIKNGHIDRTYNIPDVCKSLIIEAKRSESIKRIENIAEIIICFIITSSIAFCVCYISYLISIS